MPRVQVFANSVKQDIDQDQLKQKPEERGDLEINGLQATAEPIIDRQGEGNQRPVGAIGRQNAKRARIGEEQGSVPQTANIGIVDDGVAIVEMKSVAEMVGIGEPYGAQHQGDEGCSRETARGGGNRHHAEVALDLGLVRRNSPAEGREEKAGKEAGPLRRVKIKPRWTAKFTRKSRLSVTTWATNRLMEKAPVS